MIEMTGIVEIFQRILHECLHGERLGVLPVAGQHWLRNTEQMFYQDSPEFTIYAIRSQIRPDPWATRRNAYYRMFGLGANKEGDDNKAFVMPEASNREFVATFEAFLREAWRGIENFTNTSGSNPTTNQAVANLARRLQEMLSDRRQFGRLSREEFLAVAMMSWYHLTVEFNSSIVVDLRAQGASLEQRTNKLAAAVSYQGDGKVDSYFRLAEPMSRLLSTIETTGLNTPANAPVLYAPGPLRSDIEDVIIHWELTTGRDPRAASIDVNPVA